MKNLKKILSAVFFSISFCAFSEISFENPEINSQDKILFTIKQSITGSPAYSTAFSALLLADTMNFTSFFKTLIQL